MKKPLSQNLSFNEVDDINWKLATSIASLDIMQSAASDCNPESIADMACNIKETLEEVREILNPVSCAKTN